MVNDDRDESDSVGVSPDLHEDKTPNKLQEPYMSAADRIALEKWRIRQAFNYLTVFTLAALTAVCVSPTAEVRVVAVAVAVAAFGLVRFLLRGAYRRK